jgi:hypothetical protein
LRRTVRKTEKTDWLPDFAANPDLTSLRWTLLIDSIQAFANGSKGNVNRPELSFRVIGSASSLAVEFVPDDHRNNSPALNCRGSGISFDRMQTTEALYHVLPELAAELSSSPALIFRTEAGNTDSAADLLRVCQFDRWNLATIRNLKRGDVC